MSLRGTTIASFLAEAEESLALLGSQLKKSQSEVRLGASLDRDTSQARPCGAHQLRSRMSSAVHASTADGTWHASKSVPHLCEPEDSDDVKDQLVVQSKALLRVDRRLQAFEVRLDNLRSDVDSRLQALEGHLDSLCSQEVLRREHLGSGATVQVSEGCLNNLCIDVDRRFQALEARLIDLCSQEELRREHLHAGATVQVTEACLDNLRIDVDRKFRDLEARLNELHGHEAWNGKHLGTGATVQVSEGCLDKVRIDIDHRLQALEDRLESLCSEPPRACAIVQVGEGCIDGLCSQEAFKSEHLRASASVLVGVQDPAALKPQSPIKRSPIISAAQRRSTPAHPFTEDSGSVVSNISHTLAYQEPSQLDTNSRGNEQVLLTSDPIVASWGEGRDSRDYSLTMASGPVQKEALHSDSSCSRHENDGDSGQDQSEATPNKKAQACEESDGCMVSQPEDDWTACGERSTMERETVLKLEEVVDLQQASRGLKVFATQHSSQNNVDTLLEERAQADLEQASSGSEMSAKLRSSQDNVALLEEQAQILSCVGLAVNEAGACHASDPWDTVAELTMTGLLAEDERVDRSVTLHQSGNPHFLQGEEDAHMERELEAQEEDNANEEEQENHEKEEEEEQKEKEEKHEQGKEKAEEKEGESEQRKEGMEEEDDQDIRRVCSDDDSGDGSSEEDASGDDVKVGREDGHRRIEHRQNEMWGSIERAMEEEDDDADDEDDVDDEDDDDGEDDEDDEEDEQDEESESESGREGGAGGAGGAGGGGGGG